MSIHMKAIDENTLLSCYAINEGVYVLSMTWLRDYDDCWGAFKEKLYGEFTDGCKRWEFTDAYTLLMAVMNREILAFESPDIPERLLGIARAGQYPIQVIVAHPSIGTEEYFGVS